MNEQITETIHNSTIQELARILAIAGFRVRVEQDADHRRVDLVAQKDELILVMEVVDTHYGGALGRTTVEELVVRIQSVSLKQEALFAQFIGEKDEKVIREFRAIAGSRFGNKQGAIKKALLEAIGEWTKKN